ARLFDIARHVRPKCRQIGFAVEAFAGNVIVSELNDDVRRLVFENLGPVSLGGIALRAAAVAGSIDQRGRFVDVCLEAGAPASSFVDRGIANERDSHRAWIATE